VTLALLDVNVLLAPLDSDHVDHGRTHDWLEGGVEDGWASCARKRLRAHHQPASLPEPHHPFRGHRPVEAGLRQR